MTKGCAFTSWCKTIQFDSTEYNVDPSTGCARKGKLLLKHDFIYHYNGI